LSLSLRATDIFAQLGIISWEDAKLCMELGFKAIYISNHGGRLLETAPTAVEILLDIHKNAPEVIEKMEIYADGGVRHGSDIVKLLALGAKGVGVGRPSVLPFELVILKTNEMSRAVFSNAWGLEGVEKFISMLKRELITTLMLLGVNDIKQLDRSYINTKAVEAWLF